MKIEFDDIIFSLQKNGGASVYWKEITSRIGSMKECSIIKTKYSKARRGIPVFSNADVFHSSHFRFSIFGKAKNVSTAYDLIYEKELVENSTGSRLNLMERKLSYFAADAIICISENTKIDLLEFYPALKGRCPIYVIYLGINNDIGGIESSEITSNDYPYILHVGGRDGYKNFRGALEGYLLSGIWRDGVKLICTGSKFSETELKLFNAMNLKDMVVCEENVVTKRLYKLYKHAYCLLYTSFYEGFGLPPIEAMSCGCPVIASNTSSIPEVVADAAVLVNPYNVQDIADGILKLGSTEVRKEFILKGINHAQRFSWDKTAYEHFKVYKEIL